MSERPSDRAIAQAWREWAEPHKGVGPFEDDLIYSVEERARELDATAAPVVVGEDVPVAWRNKVYPDELITPFQMDQTKSHQDKFDPLFLRPAQDAKDANRYRFLRNQDGYKFMRPFICIFAGSFGQWTGEHADREIDASLTSALAGIRP